MTAKGHHEDETVSFSGSPVLVSCPGQPKKTRSRSTPSDLLAHVRGLSPGPPPREGKWGSMAASSRSSPKSVCRAVKRLHPEAGSRGGKNRADRLAEKPQGHPQFGFDAAYAR